MILDTVSGKKSYQIQNNKGYDFNGNPYSFIGESIDNEFYTSI